MATLVIYITSESGSLESYHATTYATARSGGGSLFLDLDGQFPKVGQHVNAGQYSCFESFLEFGLSGIPTGSTINSATLALAPNNNDDSLENFTFRARDVDYGATLTTADYIAGASLSATGSLRAHKLVNSGSWTPNGTYVDFDDDAMAAIVESNIGGTLRLVVYSDRLEAGTTPTQAEWRYFGGLTDGSLARLTVDYTEPNLDGRYLLESGAPDGYLLEDSSGVLIGEGTTGGTTYPRTAGDSVTFTDAAARVLTLGRTGADTVTATDSASRLLTLLRSAADSVTFTDAATRLVTALRSAADTVTFTDAAVRVLTLLRSAADTVTPTDAAARVLALIRSAGDTVTFTDAAAAIRLIVRTAADTVTFTDAATRVVTLARTAADTVTFTDAATRLLTLARTAADTVTATDAATRALTLLRTAADSVSFTDAATRVLSLVRTAADSVGFTDSASRVVTLVRSAADSVSFTDAASRALTLVRSAADSVGFTDAATRVLALVRSAAQTVTFTDAVDYIKSSNIAAGVGPVIRAALGGLSRIMGGSTAPTIRGARVEPSPDITGSAAGPDITDAGNDGPDIQDGG